MNTKTDETKALLLPILQKHVPDHVDAILGNDNLVLKAGLAIHAIRNENLANSIRAGAIQQFDDLLEHFCGKKGFDLNVASCIRFDLENAATLTDPSRVGKVGEVRSGFEHKGPGRALR